MDRTLTRLIAILLGLWIGLMPVMLAAQAACISSQELQVLGDASSDCDCCPQSEMSDHTCKLACLNAQPSTAALSGDLVYLDYDETYPILQSVARAGMTIPPDPPPPRRSAIV